MKKLECHPLNKLLPDISDENYQALKNDIADLGVLNPILLLEGKILDGRHRYKACIELGLDYPIRILNNKTDPIDILMALDIYIQRLTPQEYKEIWEKLLESYERQCSHLLKVSKNLNQSSR